MAHRKAIAEHEGFFPICGDVGNRPSGHTPQQLDERGHAMVDPSQLPSAERYIEAMSSLASDFGPFFFSVLFLLIVTTTARRWYKETCTRQPPAELDERVSMRSYFWTAAIVGVTLSFVAVGWYVYKNIGKVHAYHVVFVDLKPNQYVDLRDEVCYAKYPPQALGPDVDFKQFECVIVRDRPFNRGDVYTIHYREVAELSGSGQVPQGESVDVTVMDPEHLVLRFKVLRRGGHPTVEQQLTG